MAVLGAHDVVRCSLVEVSCCSADSADSWAAQGDSDHMADTGVVCRVEAAYARAVVGKAGHMHSGSWAAHTASVEVEVGAALPSTSGS